MIYPQHSNTASTGSTFQARACQPSESTANPMRRGAKFFTALAATLMFLFLAPLAAQATTYPANTTYYISNTSCSNSNPGTSMSMPWCDFSNVNGNIFSPGDQILLDSGSTWDQELDLQGTGTSSSGITVNSYGSGNRPLIKRDSEASELCIKLTNPDYWTISNLAVENAGIGILAYFTTNEHNGLHFGNIYASNITGINVANTSVGDSGGAAYNVQYGAGITLSASSSIPALTGTEYTLNNLSIGEMEGTGNVASVFSQVCTGTLNPGAGTGYGIQNAFFQNLYLHDDGVGGAAVGTLALLCFNNITVSDSVFNNNGGDTYLSTGTTGVFTDGMNNYVFRNDVVTNTSATSPESPDGTGWDNEHDDNAIQFYGDYFAGNAGAGIELLAHHGSGDYDSNNVATSNLFVNNGGGGSNGSGGAIATTGTADTPTINASENLYYEPSYGFDEVFNGSGSLSGFTLTDNLAADASADTWNSVNGFSSTPGGANQWTYQYWNGSSWSTISSYVPWVTLYTSAWETSSGAAVMASMMQPDACNSCWTSRTWTAPKAGAISIRAWAAMSAAGGSGVLLKIQQNGVTVWGATALAGTNTTGFSTNVDLTVAQNDTISFMVNNNGSGNDTDDRITWAPNIAYTTGANLLTNPTWATGSESPWLTWVGSGSSSDVYVQACAGRSSPPYCFPGDPDWLAMESTTGGYYVSAYQGVTGQPSGHSFTASVYAWTDASITSASLVIQDGPGGTTLCSVTIPANNGGWTQYSCTGTVPPDGKLSLNVGGEASSTSEWIVWDNALLAVQ